MFGPAVQAWPPEGKHVRQQPGVHAQVQQRQHLFFFWFSVLTFSRSDAQCANSAACAGHSSSSARAVSAASRKTSSTALDGASCAGRPARLGQNIRAHGQSTN